MYTKGIEKVWEQISKLPTVIKHLSGCSISEKDFCYKENPSATSAALVLYGLSKMLPNRPKLVISMLDDFVLVHEAKDSEFVFFIIQIGVNKCVCYCLDLDTADIVGTEPLSAQPDTLRNELLKFANISGRMYLTSALNWEHTKHSDDYCELVIWHCVGEFNNILRGKDYDFITSESYGFALKSLKSYLSSDYCVVRIAVNVIGIRLNYSGNCIILMYNKENYRFSVFGCSLTDVNDILKGLTDVKLTATSGDTSECSDFLKSYMERTGIKSYDDLMREVIRLCGTISPEVTFSKVFYLMQKSE